MNWGFNPPTPGNSNPVLNPITVAMDNTNIKRTYYYVVVIVVPNS